MEELFKKIVNPNNPKILAVGKNYVKHVQEMGGDEPPKEPVIFQKPFTSIFLVDKPQILKLPELGHEIHHEIELGFMISKQGKNIKKEEWYDYVGGYFLALDLTDRELQAHFKKQGFPWDLSKGQDLFFPISNLIEKEKIEDPYNLTLELRINDKIVQHDKTSSMYYKIADLICYISKFMTLNPGDLVLTGTPHGVGPLKQNDQLNGILKQDDTILARIDLQIQ
ncbi:unnamed protein product [Paramecium pentaurelia]|uniref:Fumarylacetoacetase-like C-terminal domain-containing protein n=1 Tax=Paramecium pentaurelia TaxID=43138 RepID=A0A8S1SGB0_9CILI|nr:unnamed protein product [Paramecium pentaurelia]